MKTTLPFHTPTTGSPPITPIERVSKTDLVTILTAYQMMYYSFIDIISYGMCVKIINLGVLTWGKYNYPHRTVATTGPPPNEKDEILI